MRKEPVYVTRNGQQIHAGNIVTPGEPVQYWHEKGPKHKFQATAADGREVQFYTHGAAHWWLFCVGSTMELRDDA